MVGSFHLQWMYLFISLNDKAVFARAQALLVGYKGADGDLAFYRTRLNWLWFQAFCFSNEMNLNCLFGVFLFFLTLYPGLSWRESPYRRHVDVNLFSRFKVNWGVVKAVWTSGHWKYFQLAFYLTLRRESEIRQAKQMVRWLWQTIIKTT